MSPKSIKMIATRMVTAMSLLLTVLADFAIANTESWLQWFTLLFALGDFDA